MKRFIRLCSLILSTAALFAMLAACETPLSIGSKINTEKPVINNAGDDNQPGSYLQGTDNTVTFEVQQEFGINKVYMTLYWIDENGNEQSREVPAVLDPATGLYQSTIDTSDIPDGQIRAQVTAVDVSGNRATTTDIIYTVKNLPPQIEMSIPGIRGGTMYNKDGTKNPLYLTETLPDFDDPDLNKIHLRNDPVYIGFDLMGLAEDNYGIEAGYPRIKIWPVPVDESDYVKYELDAEGNPEPDSKYDEWHPVKKPTDISGLKATRFSYDISKVAGNMAGDYRFILVTKDLFGNENFYPYRTDNRADNGKPVSTEDHPNKYIQINYMAADIPIVMIESIPMYYNGIGKFEVEMIILSQNELKNVKAYISDTAPDFNADTDPSYDLLTWEEDPEKPNSYHAVLSIENPDGWKETANGTKFVHIIATDVLEKVNPAAFRNFIFDKTPPEVEFDRPTAISKIRNDKTGELPQTGGSYVIFDVCNEGGKPEWFTGQKTIGGSSLDGMSGIREVYYHIGYLGDDEASGNELAAIYENLDIWENTNLDKNRPVSELGWNGNPYAWSYTDNFNEYGMANKDKIQTSKELGLPDTVDFETPDKDKIDKDARFYLPFYVKAVDGAGNYTIAQYKLCVDPNMDIPHAQINYPEKDSIVGGEVRMSGIASDNYKVHSVQIRIKKDIDLKDDDPQAWYIPEGATPCYPRYNDYSPAVRYADEDAKNDKTGWFRANKTGDDMTVSWYFNINSDGGLNPLPGDAPREVRIEARAVDTKFAMDFDRPDWIGPAEVITVKFSNDVPQISNPKITKEDVDDKDYIEGITTSGTFTVSLTITDAEDIINASANMEPLIQNYTRPNLPTGWSLTDDGTVARRKQYTLKITINSDAIFPYGTTGAWPLEVTAENERASGNLSTKKLFTIGIDNFFPTADIETAANASSSTFPVVGTAKDYGDGFGTIQGLERMLVYFEKAEIKYSGPGNTGTRTVTGTGDYLNPRAKPIPNTGTENGDSFYTKTVYTSQGITWDSSMPAMITYRYMRDGEGAPGPDLTNTIKFPLLQPVSKGEGINATVVWESPHAMVIDYQELGAEEDLDEDGTYGEVWDGVADKTWQARMDTTAFPDGPLMVHYVIMDRAGNATHYQKDIYIENKKPQIDCINLGTDVNIDGNVSDDELLPDKTQVRDLSTGNRQINFAPEFRIRNTRFRIDLETSAGNGTKHYKVSYVTANNEIAANDMVRGEVYTITSVGGAVDWTKYGAPNINPNTTFVASGPGPIGDGKVIKYTTTELLNDSFTGDTINNILFNNFAGKGVLDSTKDSGDITVNNERRFIIKVYDSTVPTAPENDQLAHAVLIAVDIDNNDAKPPVIDAAPFGEQYVPHRTDAADPDRDRQSFNAGDIIPPNYIASEHANYVNNYNKNIVTLSGSPKGYVQYAAAEGGTADISGMVIFTGLAADNQRISRVTVQISGYDGGNGTGEEFDIAKWDPNANDGGGDMVPYDADNTIENVGKDLAEWGFKIDHNYLTMLYGHVLNWEFAWDSSTVDGMVAEDVDVTFKAYDATGNASPPSTVTVNVVPYISEIQTGLSGAYSSNPSAFNRSANGWYPVRENEPITIKGFNLGDGTDIATTATINGTNAVVSNISKNQVTVNVGTNTASGPLVLTVNGVESFNNRNANVRYNLEPNGVNNNILTNSRNLYVWNTGYLINDALLNSPFMRMNPSTGDRYVIFGRYFGTTGHLKLIPNNVSLSAAGAPINSTGTTAANYAASAAIETYNNRYLNTTLAIDANGAVYAASSNMTAAADAGFNFYSRPATTTAVSYLSAHATNDNSKRRLMQINGDSNRFKIPRIATQTTAAPASNTYPTRVFMSHYVGTGNNNPVLFYYGNIGAASTNFGGSFNPATVNNASANNYGGAQIVADSTQTKANGGVYTAAGALSNGLPVVVWYDENEAHQCLWISHGNTIPRTPASANSNTYFSTNNSSYVNTSTATWQANAVKIADASGTHVDMVIDGNDNIHLAYYDVINGGLHYALIPPKINNGFNGNGDAVSYYQLNGNNNPPALTGAAAAITVPDPGNIKKAKVDTYLAAGTKIMLNIREENGKYVPYISYFHASFAETRNAIRVAWRKDFTSLDFNGTDGNDLFTGKWEVMTVPAQTVPVSDEFICNGVPSSVTGWSNNLPSSLSSTLRYTGIDTSILVSYMTQSWYEGAVLKYDITASPGQ